MHEHTRREKKGSALDLVIVGSGASASFTLLHYLERLEGLRSRASIAVIEKSGDFHGGIAYGKRSGEHALTITTLADFLPPEELEAFTRWIDERCDGQGSSTASAEIATLAVDGSSAGSRHQQCIRRRLFGRYLASRVEVAIADAERLGDATVELIQAEVHDIHARAGEGYKLVCRQAGVDAATRTLEASKVVLCLGSPPTRHLDSGKSSTVSGTSERIIDGLYEGDYDDRLREITAHFAAAHGQGTRPRLLIVGSNASAMELLYSLYERHVNAGLDAEITVVSRMGTLPELSHKLQGDQQDAIFDGWMKRLMSKPRLTAEHLFESARTMMAEARAEGQPLVAYNGVVNRLLAIALASMSQEEVRRFITRYANLLGRYKRLAEKEYIDAATALQRDGMLGVIKGSVESMQEMSDGVSVSMLSDEVVRTETFDYVFNCSGAEALDENSSIPLVRNLLDRGLVVTEPGQIGFLVDEQFQTSKGLYVMGPLLSGNIINGQPVWHMEHCGRIIHFSRMLADVLADQSLTFAARVIDEPRDTGA